MTLEQQYRNLFSKRVVKLVKTNKAFSEVECEGLVRTWCLTIKKEHRPSVVSVLMQSKRELWGLTQTAL